MGRLIKSFLLLFLQVKEILQLRIKEEAASQLSVSVYDTERNEKAKLHRQELVQNPDIFTTLLLCQVQHMFFFFFFLNPAVFSSHRMRKCGWKVSKPFFSFYPLYTINF